MLIQWKTHRSWCALTLFLAGLAIVLHWWLGRNTPGGLSGGTQVGLLYGLAGSALMIFAGLLSAHRRLMHLRRWLGKRQWWLRGHIWLGGLSFVVILCHSNYRLGGPLEVVLWAVFAFVIVSGVVGLIFQAMLPRLMTERVSAEAPYEQIDHVCEVMRREADEKARAALGKLTDEEARKRFAELAEMARDFLRPTYDAKAALANPLAAELVFSQAKADERLGAAAEELKLLQSMCDERRQLAEQARLHRWMHHWLYWHIPVTIALLVLGVLHAVMSSIYW